jgi:hypothetical protein
MMKTTREKIEVMEAEERGEKIQFRFNSGMLWYDYLSEITARTKPSWDWKTYDYRAAPKKPREFWANDYGTHMGSLFASKEEAERVAKEYGGPEYKGTLHLVEQL